MVPRNRTSTPSILAPYLVVLLAIAGGAALALTTLADPDASGIVEEGITTTDAALVATMLVGIPTALVALVDGGVLVGRPGLGSRVVRWLLAVPLALFAGLMVFTVGATACDSTCTSAPTTETAAATAAASAVVVAGAGAAWGLGSVRQRGDRAAGR